MTRFARAKGSKSCNARVEEDSTSWSEFKRQIEEKKYHSTNVDTSSSTSAETFLKKYKAGTPTETSWADFGDEQESNNLRKKSSKKRKLKNADSDEQVDREKTEKLDGVDQSISFGSPKKQSKKHKPSNDDIVDGVSLRKEEEVKEDLVDQSDSFRSPKKRSKKRKSPNNDTVSLEQEEEVNVDKVDQSDGVTQEPPESKKKKNCKKPIPTNKCSEDKSENLKEDATCKDESNVPHENSKNIKWNKIHKRRKPFVQSSTIHINGVSIQISKFDGFDVKTEDALRLKELRSKMLKEGIPKAEVDIVIKRERRNAEKALSREKKKVCFNCRRAGHLLSECPELGLSKSNDNNVSNVNSGSIKLCYKCGSTEHTHFQCKVEKKDKYSFATCFICKEQGHISSQCPDNPKGLYPQGGCCKVCGEVTHLKKDCPKLCKERTENTMTLDTLPSESNPDSFAERGIAIPKQEEKKLPNKQKVIKF